jgi:hypothetical protein
MFCFISIIPLIFLKTVSPQTTTIVSCNDNFLASQNCTCSIKSNVQYMSCNGNYLTNSTQNTLPGLNTTVPLGVEITNTYTMFPTVPISYLPLTNLNLKSNKIPRLGDLTNLANLLTFYMGYNLISELTPQLGCVLTQCQRMDFSYNKLEIIYLEDFVCDTNTSTLDTTSNYVFSSLHLLVFTGNSIKVNF